MSLINKGRMFGRIEGDFVVFMIGMRINKLWQVNKWFPSIQAMPKMLKELFADPDAGLLGIQSWFGRTTIMVQYWRSFEHLEKYAKDKDAHHYPAWKDFNQKVRASGAVGVWHETYKVTPGSYESIYVNMPKFGLGKAGKLITAADFYDTAKGRMENK